MSTEYNYQDNIPLPISNQKLAEIFVSVMQRVYGWMALGLLLTTIVSYYVSTSPRILFFVYSNIWVLLVLFIVQIGLVIAVSRSVAKMAPGKALALFFIYAALNGTTLSVIFLAYNLGTVVLAFGATTLLFIIMAIVGLTTKEDLTKWGPILLFGLLGLIVASVLNWFFASSVLDMIITYAGVLLFLALTVYDNNRIKKMTLQAAMAGAADETVISTIGVLGALKLYLDFINLFLFILRLFSRR